MYINLYYGGGYYVMGLFGEGRVARLVGVVTIVSCNTNGVHDICGTLGRVNYRYIVAESGSRVVGTSNTILPNINSFNSAVSAVGSCNVGSAIVRCVGDRGPFLNVYLKLRLLFPRDRRDPGMGNLSIFSNAVAGVPSNRNLGVPRVN